MTLCLLVYSALEYKIRTTLKTTELFYPNQKGKPTQTPTARWIFQTFIDVHLLFISDHETLKNIVVTNLKPYHTIFIRHLGPPYKNIYNVA
jgi:transposase